MSRPRNPEVRVRLPPHILRALQLESEQTGITISARVRLLLVAHWERELTGQPPPNPTR